MENIRYPFANARGAEQGAEQNGHRHQSSYILLNDKNLGAIEKSAQGKNITLPSYDRKSVKIGVVHIGPGYFFRALIAPIMDEIIRQGDPNWGIATVNLRGHDTKRSLDAQDGLYTLIARNSDRAQTNVIGSIIESHTASGEKGEYDAVINRIASPDTKLITMTITENGYKKDEGGQPAPTVKLIVDALQRRHEKGLPPLTVMSCDNMPDNGNKLKEAVIEHAMEVSNDLGKYIQNCIKFPSTMVDRITPSDDAARTKNLATVRSEHGIHDVCAVITEHSRCWVIEDAPSQKGDIPSSLANIKGVVLTDHPGPMELTKIRSLNGAHVAVGVIGHMMGYSLARDAMKDLQIRTFISNFIDASLSSLPEAAKPPHEGYSTRTTMSRIANHHLEDSLTRLPRDCSGGKIQNRVIASAVDLIAQNKSYDHHAFTIAAWFEYLKGFDSEGKPFDINDKRAVDSGLQAAINANPENPLPILNNTDIFRQDSICNKSFQNKVVDYYQQISELGMKEALARFNADHPALERSVRPASQHRPESAPA